jgi:hypothetical protein
MVAGSVHQDDLGMLQVMPTSRVHTTLLSDSCRQAHAAERGNR